MKGWDPEGVGTGTRQAYQHPGGPCIDGEQPFLLAVKLLFGHLPFTCTFSLLCTFLPRLPLIT